MYEPPSSAGYLLTEDEQASSLYHTAVSTGHSGRCTLSVPDLFTLMQGGKTAIFGQVPL